MAGARDVSSFDWRTPTTIGAFALVLRLFALFAFSRTHYWNDLLWDEAYYHEWAVDIATGGSKFADIYKAAPAPAYLYAAAYALFGANPTVLRGLSVVAGTGLCVFLYAFALRLFDRRTALVTGLLAAAAGPLLLFSAVPLKTIWSALALCAVSWSSVSVWDNPKARTLVVQGALWGVASVTRPNALVFFVPLAALAFAARLRRDRNVGASCISALIFTAGAALALSPFVIRNYAVAGEPSVATSQFGFNFRIANDPDAPYPFFRPSPHASGSPFEEGMEFTVEASRRAGKKLSTAEAARFWLNDTLLDAAHRPGAFARRLGQKLAVLLGASETSDHYDSRFLAELHGFFAIPWFGFGAILPLAIVGIAVARRDPRARIAAGGAAIYGATLVLFFTTERYRVPLVAMLLPFAARGAVALFDTARARAWTKAGALLSIGLATFASQQIPYPGRGDLTAMWNGYAYLLHRSGRPEDAASLWRRSVAANGAFSDLARLSLATASVDEGALAAAEALLAPIDDRSPVAAPAWETRGDVAARRGDLDRAIAAYERSVTVNAGREGPWIKLVRLYAASDRAKMRAAHGRLTELRSFRGH